MKLNGHRWTTSTNTVKKGGIKKKKKLKIREFFKKNCEIAILEFPIMKLNDHITHV